MIHLIFAGIMEACKIILTSRILTVFEILDLCGKILPDSKYESD